MSRTIVDVTDDVFTIFENVKSLFVDWSPKQHRAFVVNMWRLIDLEQELERITHDTESARTIVQIAYESVFPSGYTVTDLPRLRFGRQ